MSFHGATPPNVPNYTKLSYASPLTTPNVNPPPFLDVDAGTAGPLHTFATFAAASASGTGVTSGGTEGSYPGTGTAYANVNNIGAVPAATSVAAEAAGTEVTVLAPGNISHTYPVGTLDMGRSASAGPTLTATRADPTKIISPNALHASTMNPATNPALASISPTTLASAASGTQVITCTGTNFTNQCRIWVDNIQRDTTFTSATTISCTVNKKPSAGIWLVDVKLGGVAVPSTRSFTWT
jgi:hypothetical protein